jgi:hypothetical protein
MWIKEFGSVNPIIIGPYRVMIPRLRQIICRPLEVSRNILCQTRPHCAPPQELLPCRSQPAEAARAAYTESAAIGDDKVAKLAKAVQFASAERGGRKASLGNSIGPRCGRSVNGGSPGEHPGH